MNFGRFAENIIKALSRIKPFKASDIIKFSEKMPNAEKYRKVRNVLSSTIVIFSYKILDVCENDENVLEEIFSKNYEEHIKLSVDIFNIKERDARAVCSIITASDHLLGVKSEIIEYSPTRCIRRIKECPIYLKSKEMGKKDEEILRLCEIIMKSLCVSVAKHVNPNLRYKYTKWLAKGDPYCEEIIELKS